MSILPFTVFIFTSLGSMLINSKNQTVQAFGAAIWMVLFLVTIVYAVVV